MTPSELRHLGFSPTSRRYTTQQAGIQLRSLKAGATIARRTGEKTTVPRALYEPGARIARAQRGGLPSKTMKATDVARQFRDTRQLYDYTTGKQLTVREIQRLPEFQRLKKALHDIRSPKRLPAGAPMRSRTAARNATVRRLDALYELGYMDYDRYEDYLSHYE